MFNQKHFNSEVWFHRGSIRKQLLSWDQRLNILGPREYNTGLGIMKKGLQEDAVADCISRLDPYLVAVPLLAENRRKPAEGR